MIRIFLTVRKISSDIVLVGKENMSYICIPEMPDNGFKDVENRKLINMQVKFKYSSGYGWRKKEISIWDKQI